MVTSHEILKRTGLKTRRTLTAWYKAGLIPRPRIVKHPSGKGTIAVWPDEVMERCLELINLRKPGRPSRETKINLSIIQLFERAPIRQGRLTPEETLLANTANDGDMISREDDLPEFFITMLMPSLFPFFPESRSRSEMISKIRAKEVMRQALDIYKTGFYPILMISQDDMEVTSVSLLAHGRAGEAFGNKARLIVPLFEPLERAFRAARIPFPEAKIPSASPTARAPTDSPTTETGVSST